MDFTTFELACISGPNGAGKSSLLDGITWALFGQARKRDDAVINAASETAEVSFVFAYEGNQYRVQRTKPKNKTTVLEFHILTGKNGWKPLTERTLRETEARISETLRLDYETFVNASFFLQGKADQFTQQTSAKRKDILSSILGLEAWETYRREAAEQRKGVEDEIGTLEGRLHEINAELGEEGQRKTRLADLEARLTILGEARKLQEGAVEEMRRRAAALKEEERLVQTLAAQLRRAEQAMEDIEGRLEERRAEKESYAEMMGRKVEIQASYKAWQAARKELERWDGVAAQFHESEKQRHAPLTEIETAKARLEAERDGLLEQKKALEAADAELEEMQAQLKVHQAAVEKIQERLAERDRVQEELQKTLSRQSEARGENPLLKAQMDQLKERIDRLESTDGATCPLCGQLLSEKERAALIVSLKAEGKEKGDKYRENQDMLKELERGAKEAQLRVAEFSSVEVELREGTRLVDQSATHIEIVREQAAAWKADGAPRLKDIEKQLSKETFAKEARAALAKVDAELKKIGYDAAEHDAARKAEVEQRAAQDEMSALENAKAALAPLEREIGDLEKRGKAQEKEIAEQRRTHDEAAAALAAAQVEAPNVAEAERKMLELQEEENKARLEVGAARQEVDVLGDLKTRKTELEDDREMLAWRVGQYKALERAFGKDGVPAMLIEQALPQIETRANEILERLSSGSMSVRFVTQQAYKDTKREDLKETLDIQISDSAGTRDYEMFSGGEAFRINFAIRLALSEVLAQRAGARLQTLVIDEGFGSQDEAGRQRLIEAINLVKDDFAKILVITHIDALKEAFPNRIEVTKTPGGSAVQVV